MLLAAEPGTLIFVIVVIPLVVLLAKGLANPRTRPFVIGLGCILVAGFVLLTFGYRAVRVENSAFQARAEQAQEMARAQQENARAMAAAQRENARAMARAAEERARALAQQQELGMPEHSAAEKPRPQMPLTAALQQAVVRAWLQQPPPAITPAKPPEILVHASPPEVAPPDVSVERQRPGWVDANQERKGGVDLRTVHVGPYTTPLECDREAPKAVQAAVGEYAEILLNSRSARDVHLPEDALQRLVRDRWPEDRNLEIDGAPQKMHTLHLLIAFDPVMQVQIQAAAERTIVFQRLQEGGLVLGGVLGVLALAWSVLRMATK